MIELKIPGRGEYQIRYLVLDFNGTIALDGIIVPEIKPLLQELAQKLEIYVLTADTFGTARTQCQELPLKLHCLQSNNHTKEKGEFVASLGGEHVVAMGNGQNDLQMIYTAVLGFAILGDEGCAVDLLSSADLVVPGIERGLELLLKPKRLIATLRR